VVQAADLVADLVVTHHHLLLLLLVADLVVTHHHLLLLVAVLLTSPGHDPQADLLHHHQVRRLAGGPLRPAAD
jgi:hypothetical protein